MTTDLRLLLDECLRDELAECIKKWSAVNAKWVNDSTDLPGTTDCDLMDIARAENRIMVTVETRLTEKQFPICTHPGIIVFRARKHNREIIFKNFMLSGQRARARKAVTYLKAKEVTFKEMGPVGRVVEESIPWPSIKSHKSAGDSLCIFPRRS